MPLELGSERLEREILDILQGTLPKLDEPATGYVAHLFATSQFPTWEGVRLHWTGVTHLEVPDEPIGKGRVLDLKLMHSRRMGDDCLVMSTFYREEVARAQPAIELVARLGRAGYKAAGFYSTIMGQESEPYNTLDDMFLPIAVKMGPQLFRNYLKDRNPPQRIILHTPYGERVLRVRYSMS